MRKGNKRGTLAPAATMRAIAERFTAQKRTSGIVIATCDVDGEQDVYAAGPADGSGAALDGGRLFEIGSNTKLFSATLLADMLVRGEVRLDDPAAAYLPPSVSMPARGGKQITLLDLATHTSGLPGLPDNLRPRDVRNPYADYTLEDLYQFLSGYPLDRDIGSRYEYSNLGFGLLGHVLALRAGKTWEEALTERVLHPLGMRESAATLSPELRARLAAGHDETGSPTPNWDIPTLAGMGALRSSANDLCKFLAASMDPASGPLGEALRLTQIPRREAWSPQTMIGLAWQIGHEEYAPIIRHSGGTGGYSSFIGFDPRQQIGVIVLANSGGSVFDIGFHLIDQQSFPLD